MDLRVKLEKKLSNFTLDISLTFKHGELSVIIGPSGAGKTTIIRLIAGLERPDKGIIKYNGHSWVDMEKKIFIPTQKRNLGYVFQEFTLFPHLNVLKNVNFATKDKDDTERLMRLFNIWHLKDSMPHAISGGERQRCAICQNLARKPKIILLDEPFSALDTEIRRKLRQELKTLKEKYSLTIIHVTHDLNEAVFLEDKIYSIVKGKVSEDWLDVQLNTAKEDSVYFDKWLNAS